MRLSVIIVAYDVAPFISLCIDSVERSTIMDYEIIVIDNASTDDTVTWIEGNHPGVTLIKNEENLGFAKACNIGAQRASGGHLLFLNPDTIIGRDSISMLLDEIQKDNIGAVCGPMYDANLTYLPESKRHTPTVLNSIGRLTRLDQALSGGVWDYYDRRDSDRTLSVEAFTGAYVMISREAWEATGGFDERYFMYGEDLDLSVRLRSSRYRISYVPDARIIHFKGGSTDQSDVEYYRSFYKSMGLYAERHIASWVPWTALTAMYGRWIRLVRGLRSVGRGQGSIGKEQVQWIKDANEVPQSKSDEIYALDMDSISAEKLLTTKVSSGTLFYGSSSRGFVYDGQRVQYL